MPLYTCSSFFNYQLTTNSILIYLQNNDKQQKISKAYGSTVSSRSTLIIDSPLREGQGCVDVVSEVAALRFFPALFISCIGVV